MLVEWTSYIQAKYAVGIAPDGIPLPHTTLGASMLCNAGALAESNESPDYSSGKPKNTRHLSTGTSTHSYITSM